MEAAVVETQVPGAPEARAKNNCFITVPEITLPGGIIVPSFQVGQYACSKDEDGVGVINADDAPWVNINYHKAREACEKSGYKLITETQWLAIAYDASQQDANWTKGKVGEGKLFRGIREGNMSSAQPGGYEPADKKERRWLVLSNGERICDLNGNVYQWVFDDVQGDEKGIISRNFATDSASITTPPYPSREKGMGDYKVWDWSGYALIRGGYWYSESDAGAFNLNGAWPGYEFDSVGFRYTKPGL